MIKRTSKKYIDNLLQNNTTWNILDIGCGYNANKFAKVICDVQDLSNHYQDKKFIRLSGNKLPFKDNEFDFVVATTKSNSLSLKGNLFPDNLINFLSW